MNSSQDSNSELDSDELNQGEFNPDELNQGEFNPDEFNPDEFNPDEFDSGPRLTWMQQARKYDKPSYILLLLFFVTAALGLPLVWYSKSFSMTWKIILTIVVTIYTLFLFACFFAVLWWCWLQIQSAL